MARSSNSSRINILVTAIGGGGHGEQILKALLHAEHRRYRLIGADASYDCPQFGLVAQSFVLPLASDPSYIDALLQLCGALDIRAVFHGCEPELKRLSAERDRFAENGVLLPLNPAGVIDLCMNKERTNAALDAMGFEPPRYKRLASLEDASSIDWFPVVVKPSLGAGGSANCYIAQDRAELTALAVYLGLDRLARSFIVQEYVGQPENEYTVGVLHDLDGKFVNSIAVHRYMSGQMNVRLKVENRTARKDLGDTLLVSSGVSHGYVGRFPEVTGQCEKIAARLGVRGAINIQCRLVDGKIKVFEINPRFSGTTSLRALMGYNEPDVLLRRHVFGEPIETHFAYKEGLVLRGLQEYLVPTESPARSWREALA